MPGVGVVADDLTGATTVGALLARRGVETTVLFERDAVCEHRPGENSALIVSTDSRAMPPEVAFARVRRATQALWDAGVRQFAKRIDTTCRGGIGPEVEGMLSALPEDHVAVIVPAMPQSKRIVVDGYSIIDSTLLARTGVARDVRTPVVESHLPTLLSGQFTLALAHVPLAVLLQGPQALRSRLLELRAEGVRVVLLDATSMEDVDLIARTVVELGLATVCVDPGPFTERVAVHSGAVAGGAVPGRTIRTEPRHDDSGTVLVVAGSASDLTHVQVQALREVGGTQAVGVRVMELLGPAEVFQAEVERVLGQVWHLTAGGSPPRVLVLAFDSVLAGAAPDIEHTQKVTGLTSGQISALLTGRLGVVARTVADEIRDSCAGFYLTGGDVMVSTCGSLGARGITLVDFVAPQIDQGVLVSGPYSGLPVVCKGGLTGTEMTAVQSVNRIFDERSRRREAVVV